MAKSPIEDGEIVDYVLGYEHSFGNQEDNYEHVSMDIESDSDNRVVSRSRVDTVQEDPKPRLSIDFDDADSLRQLLLSQVSTRKKNGTNKREEQPVSSSREATPATKNDEVSERMEVSAKRVEAGTSIECNLNLRAARSCSRSFNKELSTLQKKFQALQEKVETTSRRKRRLESSLRECDSLLSSYQKQSFELMTAVFKSSLSAASYHANLLREVETYQSVCEQALENKWDAKPEMIAKGTQTSSPKAIVNKNSALPVYTLNKNNAVEKMKRAKNSPPKMVENARSIARQTANSQYSSMQNGLGGQVVVAKESFKETTQNNVENVVNVPKTVDILRIAEVSNNLSAAKALVKRKRRRVLVDEGDDEKLPLLPFLNLRSYRLDQSFPFKFLKHPAFANKIDPSKPLCPFQLHGHCSIVFVNGENYSTILGRCADKDCPWQHDSDYSLSDKEIVMLFLKKCPSLCDGDGYGSYAQKLLEVYTVENAVRFLASQMEKS